MKESQAYAKLLNENRVKDEILQTLTRAYRDICYNCAANPDSEITDDPATNLAASCIEAFFLHRIKGSGARRLASLISGIDLSPMPSSSPDSGANYWQFVRAYIPNDMRESIAMALPSQQRTDVGCCRVWVRTCLNEGSMSSYMEATLRDRDRACRYYYDNALILDIERRTVFLELVKSLDEVELRLNLRSSLLNYWTSSSAAQLLKPPTAQLVQQQQQQHSFVHPGLNNLLARQRSLTFPAASASEVEAPGTSAAFRRVEAAVLNDAVADVRRQLEEIRRQQQQQHQASTGRHKPQAQASTAATTAFSVGQHRSQLPGNSLSGRVRCMSSWSEPVSFEPETTAGDNSGAAEYPRTSATSFACNWDANSEHQEQQQQLADDYLLKQPTAATNSCWTGVWSSPAVDDEHAVITQDQRPSAASEAATEQSQEQPDLAEDPKPEPEPALFTAAQYSVSAPAAAFVGESSRRRQSPQPDDLGDEDQQQHNNGCLPETDAAAAADSAASVDDIGENRRKSSSSGASGSRGVLGGNSSGFTAASDDDSSSHDWVLLGDELLIKNDEGYQDLLDLFPGVSQPAFVSSVSCPACFCRLDACAFEPDQHQQTSPPVTDRYDGRLYCASCCQLKSPCPRDILDNWDFTAYAMSVRSHSVLELVWSHPMIDLSKANPHLYSLQPQLAEVLHLRRQALLLWRYLSACQSNRAVSDQFRSCLAGMEYMYDSRLTLHLYSTADLCAVRSGDLRLRLLKAVQLAKGHVTQCANCRTISARCWACRREDRPILLHEFDTYAECVSLNCASVRHPDCAVAGLDRCPRCEALQRLSIDSLRFDLPDD